MKRLFVLSLVLLLPRAAQAQVVVTPTSQVVFTSADANTLIPAGNTGAGTPFVTDYQGFVFAAAADPATAAPLISGTKIPKATATALNATDFQLTFTQMGITLPACTVLPCAQYRLLIDASSAAAGSSVRTVAGESAPFTATPPALTPPRKPVAPGNLRLNP